MTIDPNKDRKPGRVSFLKILGTILSFGLVFFLIWQNWTDFIDSIDRLSVGMMLVFLLLAFLSRIMVTIRWFIILKVVEPELRFWQAFKLSFLGLFTTNVLPSTIGGDLVKLGGAIQSGLNSAAVAGSLIVDRLIGMMTMATFLPVGIFRISQINPIFPMLFAFEPGIFIKKVLEKIQGFSAKIFQTLKIWRKQPFQLLIAAGFSFIHMACTFSMVFLIFRQLGDSISWWTAGGLWVLVYFLTLIPISINGLGLQEASLSLIYTSFAGTSESNSLVLALMIRILFIIASLPGALFLPKALSGDRTVTEESLNKNLKEKKHADSD